MYYTIGEVSRMFHVNASLLRFWEKEFNFEISKKTKKGNRLFSIEEIEKINSIYDLVKIQGFTLEGAKKQLKSNKNVKISNPTSNTQIDTRDIILRLTSIKEKLLELRSN